MGTGGKKAANARAHPEAADRTDARITRLALRSGLCGEEAIDRAKQHRKRASAPSSLAQALLDIGAIDRAGVRKLEGMAKVEAAPGIDLRGYEILEVLGQGGMGTVFLARQQSLDRLVALKVLDRKKAANETYRQRFLREARTLARLNHENIIAGIDVGHTSGAHYFAMEYVDGPSLDVLIAQEGALPGWRVRKIGEQMLRALVHAEAAGLVHRDIKPQNIMLGPDDQAKLCDLGLAMTGAAGEADGQGKAVGTPHYVSPEQARGDGRVDIRSDIYSLGATLYHAVTGVTPFEGSSAMVLMTRHLTEEPAPAHKRKAGVSRPLSDLIARMMAKDPADRFQTPGAALAALLDLDRPGGAAKRAGLAGGAHRRKPKHGGRAGGGHTGSARTARSARDDDRPRRRLPPPRRGKGGVIAGFVFVLALTAGFGAIIWKQRTRTPPPKPVPLTPAEEEAASALLRGAVQRFKASPQRTDAVRAAFQAVVDRYPTSRAAESARGILDKELGAPDE